jgi:hypothetical protein
MENAPVTLFRGRNVPPELREKFQNWMFEAYIPILLKIPPLEAVEYYQILKENPLYPGLMGVYHYQNAPVTDSRARNPDWNAVFRDQATTFARVENFWSEQYYLLRSFGELALPVSKDGKTGDTPVMHIEAFRLSAEEQERYNEWFVKWAYRVYIPVLMKLPGLNKYSYYQQTGLAVRASEQYIGKRVVTEYPRYISVLLFENLKAFENYENSPELVAFKRAMSFEISNNIVPEWYVQYQLVRSWRK